MSADGKHGNNGGETPGLRETMDRFQSQLIRNGADPKYAEQKAREQALRYDREQNRRTK